MLPSSSRLERRTLPTRSILQAWDSCTHSSRTQKVTPTHLSIAYTSPQSTPVACPNRSPRHVPIPSLSPSCARSTRIPQELHPLPIVTPMGLSTAAPSLVKPMLLVTNAASFISRACMKHPTAFISYFVFPEECIKLLLECGVDVKRSTSDASHRTPLHLAVERGDERIVRLLLKAGADYKVYATVLPSLIKGRPLPCAFVIAAPCVIYPVFGCCVDYVLPAGLSLRVALSSVCRWIHTAPKQPCN
jgi:hypothetical protein